MLKFKFHKEKAISALLYVAENLIEQHDRRCRPDFHKIFKILYFADQKHIVKYGRPIIGDHYIAMKDGPVPSNIYDILKIVRGDALFCSDEDEFNGIFDVKNNHYIHPKRKADLDELSESNLECIDESIKENKYLSFKALKVKSHDNAYEKATKDDKIHYVEMAKAAGADDSILSYLELTSENDRIFAA